MRKFLALAVIGVLFLLFSPQVFGAQSVMINAGHAVVIIAFLSIGAIKQRGIA